MNIILTHCEYYQLNLLKRIRSIIVQKNGPCYCFHVLLFNLQQVHHILEDHQIASLSCENHVSPKSQQPCSQLCDGAFYSKPRGDLNMKLNGDKNFWTHWTTGSLCVMYCFWKAAASDACAFKRRKPNTLKKSDMQVLCASEYHPTPVSAGIMI